VISARLWHRRFASDPGVVGRAIQLSGRPYVVTGVMPEGIEDLVADRVFQGAELWTPLAYEDFASRSTSTGNPATLSRREVGRLDQQP
jgi:hypothetical protein